MPNPPLPAELLDCIVDHLYDAEDALRNCCLVSKSWIPRTRMHLFTDVQFKTEANLESWKKTFPDPLTSPAHYTKALLIDFSHIITAADVEAGGWIRGFPHVVHLEVHCNSLVIDVSEAPLVPLHGSPPVVKSLCVEFVSLPSSRVFDLIVSFPLLEDLAVFDRHNVSTNNGNSSPTIARPSKSPLFTGSLELMTAGMRPIARRLLSVPGGIHFRKLTLKWSREEDVLLTLALVERCSRTLESFDITYWPFGIATQRPCSYRQLTSVSSPTDSHRPLKGNKIPGYDSPVLIDRCRVDHRGIPNHDTEASGASENHDLCSFLPDRLQCQHNEPIPKLSGVDGSRSPLGPIKGVTAEPPEGDMRVGWEEVGHGKFH